MSRQKRFRRCRYPPLSPRKSIFPRVPAQRLKAGTPRPDNALRRSTRPAYRTIYFSDTLSLCGKRNGTKALKYSAKVPAFFEGPKNIWFCMQAGASPQGIVRPWGSGLEPLRRDTGKNGFPYPLPSHIPSTLVAMAK